MGELLVLVASIIAALSFITGILVLIGTRKTNLSLGVFFFLMMLGASAWSICSCLTAKFELFDGANPMWWLDWIILSASILALIAVYGYNLYEYKLGRILLPFFCIFGAVLCITPAIDVMHIETLFKIPVTWYTICYVVFVSMMTMSIFFAMWYRHGHTSVHNKYNKSSTVFSVGVIIVCLTASIFNLVLPLANIRSLMWISPLLLSIVPICFLFAALKQHELALSSKSLIVISYVIFLSFAVLFYIAIITLLDIIMFGDNNEIKNGILLYSLITSLILLVLMKVFMKGTEFLKSMISTNTVNLSYLLGRIQKINSRTDLSKIARLVADHIHVEYVGIIKDGKLYGSDKLDLSTDEIQRIALLNNCDYDIWQTVDLNMSYMLSSFGLKKVAKLNDYMGQQFGQVVLGGPVNKTDFNYNDLRVISIVLNEVGAAVGGGYADLKNQSK